MQDNTIHRYSAEQRELFWKSRQNVSSRPAARENGRLGPCVRAVREAAFQAYEEERLMGKGHRRAVKALVLAAKQKPCMDCQGCFHAEAMEFDHRNGLLKLFNLSQAGNRPLDVVKAEIEKCDVVCANCHRVRTFKRRRRR